MLRRLLAVLLPVAFVLVTALGVPLATLTAQQATEEVYVDRLNDVGRFASLADTALDTGRTEALRMELERYEELYGIAVALLDPSGSVVLSSRPAGSMTSTFDTPGARNGLEDALAGFRPEPPTAVWPWTDDPLILVEPVGRDSEVVGAIVLVSPTDGLRTSILADWALLGLLGLLPLAGLASVAWPVSLWVLRPVRRLDAATAGVTGGDLSARADSAGGPPELRRLAASFNTMVDVVEEALHRQRAFVSDASHQLRNPLASLRLAVENLGPHVSGPEGRAAFDDAVDEAKAMNTMLNALLAATRLETTGRTEPVELDEVMLTRLPRWRALGEDRGVEVVSEVPGGLRPLEPPGGLGSVLDELMANALRLSGGTRVVLSASVTPPDGPDRPAGTEIRVTDDGAGLSPQEREQAFNRFWRSPRHQNVTGTGLGLAICADLVTKAGGTLLLESGAPNARGGRGLAAVVVLPGAGPRP